MEDPLVSVIIPNFNREKLISHTLTSVINQSYQNWEVLVIDDGSTDHSKEVLKKFAEVDPRIRFFDRNRLPNGANTCRNIGIKYALGKYIIFLDSDDLLAPFCIEQRVKFFEENQVFDFVVFPQLFFKKKPYDLTALINIYTKEPSLYRFLNLDTVWLTTQPIWKKEALLLIGGFDEELMSWQDLDLHLRAFSGELQYFYHSKADPDCFWRINHPGKITNYRKILDYIPSRKKVILLASSFLNKKNINKSKVSSGIRILTTSVILNLLKANEYNGANEFLNFGIQNRFFETTHQFKLRLVIFLHTIKADKVKGFLRVRNFFLGDLLPRKRLWGKHHYRKSSFTKAFF